MDDLPSVALASRLWHSLVLVVIGSVAIGAGYDAGLVPGLILIAGLVILVGGYLGLAVPRLRGRLSETPMLVAVMVGAVVMIADRPAAVALLFGIVPQLFYFAPLRVALLSTTLLTAVGCLSFVVNDVEDPARSAGALVFATCISMAIGIWLSQIFHLNARQRDTIAELEESRALVQSMARMAGAAEERAQIGQDIHDGMAQQLSAMVMVLREAGQRLESGRTELVGDRLDVARRQCDLALAECRFLIGQQSTAGMTSTAEIVRHVAALFEGAAGVPTTVRVDLAADDLDAEQRATVQKVLTETLSNCLHHAAASAVEIALASTTTDDGVSGVRLDVADDGRGFYAPAGAADEPSAQVHGYGLPGLHARVTRQGGTLEISSRVGSGTAVSVTLPRHAPAGTAAD